MATENGRPTFRELAREECDAVLARNYVGRIAWSHRNKLEIEPIHYVRVGTWLFGRTSPGAKMDTLGGNYFHTWPVVFEVDEVEALFRWRSVVAHGSFYPIDPKGAPWEREEWAVGVEALRRLIPETFAEGDPVPFRTVLFGIAVQEVSGREARPGGET
jgi:nitroimidazol reductase NimA-like FMN-containing flavoprotein (pyridoxamine 5'-phosphate oxidase superfamily)